MIVAYVRVSTEEQNEARQVEALEKFIGGIVNDSSVCTSKYRRAE